MICDKITSDIHCNTIVQNEPFKDGFVYVYILQLNKADGNTITQVFIKESAEEEIKFNIGLDGYYTMCRVIVPTTQDGMYYYKDGSFYKGFNEVELSELVNVNPEVSELDISYYYYFQLCRLRKCYIRAAKAILDNRASLRCDSKGVDPLDIYKRDLLWSAMNTITYLAEMGQFEEAERLLERITGCNGLCEDMDSKCGCGCGR